MNRLLAFAAAALLPVAGFAAPKPNVLFLFADDMSYETLAAAGKLDIDTPNLDRLARRGARFTHAYNMGSWSGAVCIASRTMLITGRSLWRAREVYESTDAERAAGRLWPQYMSRAGYVTYLTGKWHIKTDPAECFDTVAHVRPGMPPTVPASYNRPPPDGSPDPWDPTDPANGGYWTGGKHWSEVAADDAIAFLSAERPDDRPFFIYAAFNAPHDPRQAPKEFLDRYPLERIRVPADFLPEYPWKDAIGCEPDLRDERLAPFPRTEAAVRTHRREYFALIAHLDAQIGRVLDALEAAGNADNTWIFFTADHGLAVGHHGLFGKQNMYDDSLRVPLLVAGPGIAGDTVVDSPVYLQDVMATALEIAGAAPGPEIEFRSLLPLARGDDASAVRRDTMYGAYLGLQRAIIRDGWKLIAYPEPRVLRLYRLTDDPGESRDLAADPDRRGVRRDLFRRLVAIAKSLDDKLDLTISFPDE